MSRKPPTEPIFNVPAPVLAVIVVLAAIQAGRSLLPDQAEADFLAMFAFVPGRLTAAFDPTPVIGRLTMLASADPGFDGAAGAARFFLGSGTAQPWTAITYAFLHGGWTHVGLNAVWLLAFGAPSARRLGTLRFMVLLLAGALAGAVAHFAVDPLSLQPLVGASAAVSACMGAALRFMFRAPTPQGDGTAPPHGAPRLPLRATLQDRRALAFLAVWMVSNLVTGVAAVPLGLSDMPIAWQAHVGGFLFGLLAFPLLDPVTSRPAPPAPSDARPEDA